MKPSTRRGLAQPVVDLVVGRAAAEQHALDVLAALALAGLLGQHLARPRACRRPRSSRCRPRRRRPGSARSRAASARGAARRRSGRCRRRRTPAGSSSAGHEQLEEELAVVLVQPVGELLEPLGLALVHLLVAVRVVTDEHLGGEQVVLGDVVAELVAVLELELVLTPDFSTGIVSDRPCSAASSGMSEPNCSSTSTPADVASTPRSTAFSMPSKISFLASEIVSVSSSVGIALDPEHLLLERPSVVEGQDVQLAVVAEGHRQLPRVVVRTVSLVLYAATWSRSSAAPRTRSASRRS